MIIKAWYILLLLLLPLMNNYYKTGGEEWLLFLLLLLVNYISIAASSLYTVLVGTTFGAAAPCLYIKLYIDSSIITLYSAGRYDVWCSSAVPIY